MPVVDVHQSYWLVDATFDGRQIKGVVSSVFPSSGLDGEETSELDNVLTLHSLLALCTSTGRHLTRLGNAPWDQAQFMTVEGLEHGRWRQQKIPCANRESNPDLVIVYLRIERSKFDWE